MSSAKAAEAVLFVLDPSASMGAPADRCQEVGERLRRERARMRAPDDLVVSVIALGRNAGMSHQNLIGWQTIAGMKWSTNAFESIEARRGQTFKSQSDAIAQIVKACAERIHPTRESPVFTTLERALEIVRHECEVELPGGCAARKVFVHSDLQDQRVFEGGGLLVRDDLPQLELHLCGYGASRTDLGESDQHRLLDAWRRRLGPRLKLMAPNCPSPSVDQEDSHG